MVYFLIISNEWADNIIEIISNTEIIIISLKDFGAVKTVLLSAGDNLDGKIFVQITTVSSEENIELMKIVSESGGTFLGNALS